MYHDIWPSGYFSVEIYIRPQNQLLNSHPHLGVDGTPTSAFVFKTNRPHNTRSNKRSATVDRLFEHIRRNGLESMRRYIPLCWNKT
nr:uncharacterized protein CTRU02_15058 [Colletotrichum truncatum]KAF6781482.1 hypothetical protein CTRU02_15058 [Colletotrichum truncatum]